jgi:hypothetical protein
MVHSILNSLATAVVRTGQIKSTQCDQLSSCPRQLLETIGRNTVVPSPELHYHLTGRMARAGITCLLVRLGQIAHGHGQFFDLAQQLHTGEGRKLLYGFKVLAGCNHHLLQQANRLRLVRRVTCCNIRFFTGPPVHIIIKMRLARGREKFLHRFIRSPRLEMIQRRKVIWQRVLSTSSRRSHQSAALFLAPSARSPSDIG